MTDVPFADLSSFLKSRRGSISPQEAGILSVGRRRVLGLRREELAERAGLSVDYYTKLEQGRAGVPSYQVRASLSKALGFDESERAYLDLLVDPRPPQPRPQSLRAGLLEFVRGYSDGPAYMFDPGLDFVAANEPAREILFRGVPDELRDNMARWIFLAEASRAVFVDWRSKAEEVSGILRFALAERGDDQRLRSLVAELMPEPAFARIWRSHIVLDKNHGQKLIRTPDHEKKTLAYETLQSVSAPGHRIVLHKIIDHVGESQGEGVGPGIH
ncbi:helix-turn-helix transcriptional regulator [Segniliparus rugosus]|uniref:HTH cro/C1-type domain-containing protein n=1 Tax=Segniliparus rugosus (strain ATCC BAA-974 / DSM 45345 / CCUG 50838 / CIP 108380 / JCM 13579 / CDC 945) TaxID=679197 RepID=E5XU90_SEGRC|nr:helix-turn-helix transcriptional regulator [Segniliparus rugosus]EFV12089.1 hypothetical protein HMPREF9336_03062 [Segniliparus rugosus ATCC BAA-974]